MTLLLLILIIGFAVGATVSLVRGLLSFFLDGEQIRQNGAAPVESFGVKQNRLMGHRVLFQGIAILLVLLFGVLASQA